MQDVREWSALRPGHFNPGGKNPGNHFKDKGGWAQETVSTFWRRQKCPAPVGIRTPDCPALSLLRTPKELLPAMSIQILLRWKGLLCPAPYIYNPLAELRYTWAIVVAGIVPFKVTRRSTNLASVSEQIA